MPQPELVRAEFHCHSEYSKDSLVSIDKLRSACAKNGLQKLVITDHNSIQGALLAHNLDPQRMIVGEEIMTLQGELLAFFVTELVPPGLRAEETIAILRSQGAFISVAHPFDLFRGGHWKLADLLPILPLVDALETFNARCLLPSFNDKATKLAREYHLLSTVGSDSHSIAELGSATLLLPDFHDTSSLKHSLSLAKAHYHLSPPWVHFYSRFASWRKKHS